MQYQGPITIAALLFASLAYAFSLFGAFGRKTFQLDFAAVPENVDTGRLGTIRFGYVGFCAMGECQDYKENGLFMNYTDSYLVTGISIGIVLGCLGGIYLLFLSAALFVQMKQYVLVTMGLVFGLCLSLPLLSLAISSVGFGSPDCFDIPDDDLVLANFTWDPQTTRLFYCRPDIGSILSFVSVFLWMFALGITCCCMRVDRHRSNGEFPISDEQAVTYLATSHSSPVKEEGGTAPDAATTGVEEVVKQASPPYWCSPC